MTTLRQLGKITGYSPAAITHAFQDDPRSPPGTRARIRHLADEYAQVPNRQATERRRSPARGAAKSRETFRLRVRV